MNLDRYPWLTDLECPEAVVAIADARQKYQETGAVLFEQFLTNEALQQCVQDARAQEDQAYTTKDVHTAHLLPVDCDHFPANSVRNHEMATQVASIAFDELPVDSPLVTLYRHPTLRSLVARIVHGSIDSSNDDNSNNSPTLYLSDDPLGCCSINVFRPGYHHSFHFDESEFSTTLMLQEASITGTGLFQYTDPIRASKNDSALSDVAAALQAYDPEQCSQVTFAEQQANMLVDPPALHTLSFQPGSLFVFSGARSLHRVTHVEGPNSRLVAVLTFATQPGFCNSSAVQTLFWGRSVGS